jgi:hypothetical protein
MAEEGHANHERRIRALEQVLPSAVLDAIYADPHQWSDRPCATCRSVSQLTGRPFGCERFQIERRKAWQQS